MTEGVTTMVREFSLFWLTVHTSDQLECVQPPINIYIFIANSVQLVNENQKSCNAL